MNKTKGNTPKEFYPLATNILKLQYYSGFFDLTEIVMFDWFIVKAKAFKFKQFYYSRRRICEEVRIKEDRLTTIISRFIELGIIQVELKGLPRQHHFTVDFEQVVKCVPEIFLFTENSKLSPENGELAAFFGKLLAESSKEKKYNKEGYKEDKEEEIREEKNMAGDGSPACASSFSSSGTSDALDYKAKKAIEAAERKKIREAQELAKKKLSKITTLKALLNRTYAKRVVSYNEDRKKGQRIKSVTELSFLARNENALYELGSTYSNDAICNSFIAYVDDFLEEKIDVKKLVPYFLSRKPETKDFDTFHTYLNRFIADYGHTK